VKRGEQQKACNETVQFSPGASQAQIDARFRGHGVRKPDLGFESVSVRQQVSRLPYISGFGRTAT
jgi:hypothetical protein